jgi:CubicO group peptidase (beta-lactamase class C family)
MHKDRRQFCLHTLTLAASAKAACAGAPKKDDLDTLVEAALRAWDVPGAAVGVLRDDRIEYLAGHGVKKLGDRLTVTPDTLFPLGSCTKGFTTTALAMLVEEDKLHWDDPVRKHVPFFHLSDPLADNAVRLRDLLCHRTGVGTHDLFWYRAPWPPEEAVRRVAFLPLSRPFRTAFQYQSTMFTAVGLAVASASGMAWADIVEKRLFAPLGMKTAGCSTSAFKTEDRASGHRPNARGTLEALPEWLSLAKPDAATSIHASARELCYWLRLHLNEGVFDSKRLVSARTLRETHTPQMVIPLVGSERGLHPDSVQMSYGMAWVIEDYRGWKIVAHAGVLDGFRVQLTLVPKARLGLVVLANLHGTRMNLALSYTLLDRLLGVKNRNWNRYLLDQMKKDQTAAEKEEAEKVAARHKTTRTSHPLDAYAGSYEHPAYGTARLVMQLRGLVFRWGNFSGTVEHYHYDTFVVHGETIGGTMLTFSLNRAGEVSEMSASGLFGVVFKRKKG